MGFGNYDNDEHQRREENMSIELSDEHTGGDHEGEVTTEGGDDTDELLTQLDEIRSKKNQSSDE